MKKYLLVLVAMLLVVTGCGGKKLTCTMEENGSTAKVVGTFGKDDIVTDIEMVMSVELTKEEKEAMAGYTGMLCASFDYEGMTCETKDTSKGIDVVVGIDMSKLDTETKEEMGYTEEATYDAMKKSFEADGYTCK